MGRQFDRGDGGFRQSARGWVCPWCGTAAVMVHAGRIEHRRQDTEEEEDQVWSEHLRSWYVDAWECPRCNEVHVTLLEERYVSHHSHGLQHHDEAKGIEKIVYPAHAGRKPPPDEVPASFAQDYREAASIIDLSPQASAALSRRLLQTLLRGPGEVHGGDLNQEIKSAVANGMPGYLARDLHYVRQVGNFAAHPIKDKQTGLILPVEPAEAEHLLDVIELLFDFYFVTPAKGAEKRARMNEKLKAAGKPPLE